MLLSIVYKSLLCTLETDFLSSYPSRGSFKLSWMNKNGIHFKEHLYKITFIIDVLEKYTFAASKTTNFLDT